MKMPIYKFMMLVAALLPLSAHAAEPVAMITDLKGNVYLAGKTKPLSILSYLPPGEEIMLDTGAYLVVTYFAQSTEFSFKGPAHIVIHEQEAKALKGSAEIHRLNADKSGAAVKFVQSGKLTIATVEMRSIMLVKPALLSPVNSKVSSLTPVFTWKKLEDVEKYLLTLSNEQGANIQQAELKTNSWTPEAPLQHGAGYRWKVEALLTSGDKLNAQGVFSVADKESIDRVNAQKPPADANFSDNVTYAIFLEAEGFSDDAKNIWKELSRQRPDDLNLKRRAR